MTPDIDHVASIIGKQRLLAIFHLPVTEWGLTADEIAAIAAGPHQTHEYALSNKPFLGDPVGAWVVTCDCGWTAEHILLSRAQSQHDAHAGTAVSHIHTAEMLEA
jgi:hypothetical protein